MKFELPEEIGDISSALMDLEPQAPKNLKPVIVKAAQDIRNMREVIKTVAMQLEQAAVMRVGQMDSQSRADEVVKIISMTLSTCASSLRSVL